MSEHKAFISWTRTSPEFCAGRYSREHNWRFDGGISVPASPSPSLVPAPYSNPASVDPKEAFAAAVSSCHMLTFLYRASTQGFQVDCYSGEAIGLMAPNESGVPWMSSITLNVRIAYSGSGLPTPSDEDCLHHSAHEHCFHRQLNQDPSNCAESSQ